MPRIAQISDLHLQSTVPARQAQIEPILQAINHAKPDLTVISGDVTDDGWDSIDELRWAKHWLDERIGSKWFAVAGNHDVGNFATMDLGPINTERAESWNQVFGLSWPTLLVGDISNHANPGTCWHVGGFNSMFFGSDLPQEQLQQSWLQDETERWKQIDVFTAVFLHSPLFIDQIDEPTSDETNYWLGPTNARRAFLAQLEATGVKLIASGHVHQSRLTTLGDTHICWAPPASGTWVHAPGLPNPPMPDQTGFLMHHLGDDGTVRTETVLCAPMLKIYHHNP